MMDMRQHGADAVPSNTLQFSPQSTLINDSLFLLDRHFSPSPSMDMPSLNQPFSSNMGPDFPSVFMDMAFQNSLGISSMECIQGQGQSSNGFYATDEWSGTTTNSTPGPSDPHHHHQQQEHHHHHQRQEQQHLIVPSNQRHSALTQSSVNQSVSLDVEPQLQSFENSLSVTSQLGQDVLAGAQSSINKSFSQGGDMMSGQAQFQGMVKQLDSLTQSSLVGAQMMQGRHQAVMPKLETEGTDFQGAFYGSHQQSQSESAMSVNVPCTSSHDESFQEAQSVQMQQTLDFHNTQAGLGNSLRAGIQSVHGQQNSVQSTVYHGQKGDIPAANHQTLNPDVLFQSRHGENATGSRSGQQSDLSSQALRGLALQLQGKLPQCSLQNQPSNKYMGLPAHTGSVSVQRLVLHGQHGQGPSDQLSSLQSHSNNHSLPVRLQSQSSAQFQSLSQAQAQAQAHAQVQAQAQVQVANQHTVYQAQQLQNGSQQPLVQHNSIQSIQLAANQVLPNSSHTLQLSGAQQMIAQMQPRLLNPTFQGLKPGGSTVLQRSPSGASLGFGNGNNEGNARVQMSGASVAHCTQVLVRYIQEQQKRPADNNLMFWKNLVNEFFVPGAATRWCLSSYNSMPMGRHAQNLFPMDYWFCNLCSIHPGRGFESSTDILPRLFKIKYASGLEDELLFLDIAEERYMHNGKMVLEFPRAVHESIFPELRVVRYGRLRVTFSTSFKICSWEFCTKMHEEVVPRRSLLQQAQHLAKLVVDCDQEGSEKSAGNLKASCDEFTATARQLASKLEAPTVNDLGFSKRYVRCLQIAEIVNSMKDLISFERKTRAGPIASLANFPTVTKVPAVDEHLTCLTSSQLMNQPSQGNVSLSSLHSNVQLRQQVQMGNDLQSAVMQGSDVSGLHPNCQADPQNDCMKAQIQGLQLQPQSSNPLLTQLTARSMGSMQGSHFGTGQSQVLNSHAVSFSQLAPQIYESAGKRQLLQQAVLNQSVVHVQSLNQTGQQSLPSTPQSEMSDIRINT